MEKNMENDMESGVLWGITLGNKEVLVPPHLKTAPD